MSDKPPFAFEPIPPPKQDKHPVTEWIPIQPVLPPKGENKGKVGKSPNNYISYASDKPEIAGTAELVGKVDTVHMGQATAYCKESREAQNLSHGELSHGEDAAAILYANGTYVLVEADGVGQSYLARFASQGATSAIAENPSINLQVNVLTAETALTQIQSSLPSPNSGYSLIDDARREILNEVGSKTTLNQLSIDSRTGRVDGYFIGDGGLTILRAAGHRDHYFLSTTKGAPDGISTKHGLRGNPRNLKDVVGSDVTLNEGDTILVYSDASQHTVNGVLIIDRLCDILTQEQNPDQAIAKYFEEVTSFAIRDEI